MHIHRVQATNCFHVTRVPRTVPGPEAMVKAGTNEPCLSPGPSIIRVGGVPQGPSQKHLLPAGLVPGSLKGQPGLRCLLMLLSDHICLD